MNSVPLHKSKTHTYIIMRKSIIFALACCAMAGCGNNTKDELAHHHHEAPPSGSGHGEIVLEPESAEMFGVATDTIIPGGFNRIFTVSGTIMEAPGASAVVSAPISGTVSLASSVTPGTAVAKGSRIASVSASNVAGGDPNAAAKAALDAAKRELDRVTPLHEAGIVSTRNYNEALSAYEQAKAAYSPAAAGGAALSPISGAITQVFAEQGQYVNAGDPIAAVSSNRELTLRADLPERYYAEIGGISSASIRPGYGEVIDLDSLGARKTTSASAATSGAGYVPVFFAFRNPGSLAAGSSVQVYLKGSPRQNVLSVPLAALSEQQGNYFVYERLDEECYRKIPVSIGQSDGSRVEITRGLRGGEDIVVAGTTAVRLAESSSVVPEGHSHNH